MLLVVFCLFELMLCIPLYTQIRIERNTWLVVWQSEQAFCHRCWPGTRAQFESHYLGHDPGDNSARWTVDLVRVSPGLGGKIWPRVRSRETVRLSQPRSGKGNGPLRDSLGASQRLLGLSWSTLGALLDALIALLEPKALQLSARRPPALNLSKRWDRKAQF